MKVKDIKDGMLLITRDGNQYYHIKNRMFYWKDKNRHEYYYVSATYDDNLKCSCDSGLDIMKIYYMDELLWKRGPEWDNIQFGTKVRAWDYDDKYKLVGKFIAYDEGDEKKPFLVFIEDQKNAYWFDRCELIEGGDIVG